MNRSATASLLSATPKKNVPCFLDLAGVNFFLKVERTFFFGVLPSKYSGRWRNNADSVLRKHFSGGMVSAKPRLIWISQAEEEGFGEESSACFAGFFWRNSGRTKKYKFYFYIVPLTF